MSDTKDIEKTLRPKSHKKFKGVMKQVQKLKKRGVETVIKRTVIVKKGKS